MALTPQSGSSTTPSPEASSPQAVTNNLPFITDTAHNRYAIDSSAYPNAVKQMLGFMKGKRVLVTYYRSLLEQGDYRRGQLVDLPSSRGITRQEYQKILNLEITLPTSLAFEANPESASIGLTGEAKFLPGINPQVGDMFLMPLGDGRQGLFQISSILLGSWRDDSGLSIQFTLQSFASQSDIDPIEAAVTVTSFFSKENYLGGASALLSQDTYVYLNQLKKMRVVMTKTYHQTFFDYELNSYLRPDGVYDGYVVQFMRGKISMSDVHLYPKLLTGLDPNYKKSIWARLEDTNNTSLAKIYSTYKTPVYRNSRMQAFVSELHSTPTVSWDNSDDAAFYVFSENFYTKDVAEMTVFENLIYNAVTQRNAGDLESLVKDYCALVSELSDTEAFYRIPLYIHLIDMALRSQYRDSDVTQMSYASSSGV